MKALALSRCISLLWGDFPESKKYSLLRASHFLIIIIFCVILSGCEKDMPPPSRYDLLTSTIWGEKSICGWNSDPEIYSRIFESGGRYHNYYRIYESLHGATWSLKGNETLIFFNNEYKILALTENMLEIRVIGGFCISRFQALTITKAITVGVTALTKTSARLHGSIRTCTLTDISFEYGTSTAYGTIVTPDNNPLTGPTNKIVNVTLSGLLPETVYHYRIKAVNSSGTYYGQDQTFRTFNNTTVSDADNNIYNTVTIGSQVWMTENLKTTKYNDGMAIPLVRDSLEWKELSTPAYCWYKNDSLTNKNSYGALYNWHTVNTEKLCPNGWHVPSDQEWTTLKQYLGQEAGSKLTEGGYDLTDPLLYSDPLSRLEASNESGFSAQHTGVRTEESYFYTGYCELWSRTEDNFQSAWVVSISNGRDVLFLRDNKKYGLAVRCLKD